jgi:hypothetical protein
MPPRIRRGVQRKAPAVSQWDVVLASEVDVVLASRRVEPGTSSELGPESNPPLPPFAKGGVPTPPSRSGVGMEFPRSAPASDGGSRA